MDIDKITKELDRLDGQTERLIDLSNLLVQQIELLFQFTGLQKAIDEKLKEEKPLS